LKSCAEKWQIAFGEKKSHMLNQGDHHPCTVMHMIQCRLCQVIAMMNLWEVTCWHPDISHTIWYVILNWGFL
jgi:hypothetical protein